MVVNANITVQRTITRILYLVNARLHAQQAYTLKLIIILAWQIVHMINLWIGLIKNVHRNVQQVVHFLLIYSTVLVSLNATLLHSHSLILSQEIVRKSALEINTLILILKLVLALLHAPMVDFLILTTNSA